MQLDNVQKVTQALRTNIRKVIKGKEAEIDKVIMALLCEGHVLLEDMPGTGKTTLAKALAKSIGCDFKRIQFTPDLLPTDLMGVNIYSQKSESFTFKPGPIFTNVLLADEINRATPRTQSSLLECMEEAQVTIDGETHILQKPFIVLATQNPLEVQGTFPLPEAQLDRFFIKLSLGYPAEDEEVAILTNQQIRGAIEDLKAVITVEELQEAQREVKEVKVVDELKHYIVKLADATRHRDDFRVGISFRGSLAIMRASQALAAMNNRDYIVPDDIKAVFKDTTVHRIIHRAYNTISHDEQVAAALMTILQEVPVQTQE